MIYDAITIKEGCMHLHMFMMIHVIVDITNKIYALLLIHGSTPKHPILTTTNHFVDKINDQASPGTEMVYDSSG